MSLRIIDPLTLTKILVEINVSSEFLDDQSRGEISDSKFSCV